MSFFFDSSALVKRYVLEAESESVDALLRKPNPAICRLTEVEIASALHRRRRSGDLDAEQCHWAMDELTQDVGDFQVVEISSEVVTRARQLVARFPLRAADATQLAACLVVGEKLRHPLSFVTYDGRQADAARAEGLEVLGH